MKIMKNILEKWIKNSYIKKNKLDSNLYGYSKAMEPEKINPFKENGNNSILINPNLLPTLLAMLLRESQNRTGFLPSDVSPSALGDSFEAYIKDINANPFFNIEATNAKNFTFNGNYTEVVDKAVNFTIDSLNTFGYNEVTPEYIKSDIESLACSLVSATEDNIEKVLFVQNFTSIDNDLNYYISYGTFYTSYDLEGAIGITKDSDINLNAISFKLNNTLTSNNIETLGENFDLISIENFMKSLNSKEGIKRPCFLKK